MIQIALLGLTPIVGRRRTKKICLLSSIFRGSCRARVKDFLSDPQITKEDRLVISLNDTNNQRKG